MLNWHIWIYTFAKICVYVSIFIHIGLFYWYISSSDMRIKFCRISQIFPSLVIRSFDPGGKKNNYIISVHFHISYLVWPSSHISKKEGELSTHIFTSVFFSPHRLSIVTHARTCLLLCMRVAYHKNHMYRFHGNTLPFFFLLL